MYTPVECDQMYVCANCGEEYNRNDVECHVSGEECYCDHCAQASYEAEEIARSRYEDECYTRARDDEIEERAHVRQA